MIDLNVSIPREELSRFLAECTKFPELIRLGDIKNDPRRPYAGVSISGDATLVIEILEDFLPQDELEDFINGL